MKLRHAKWSFLLSWIITAALTLSPVMAQTVTDQGSISVAPQGNEPEETTKDIGKPVVDSSVLPELPLADTATAFPTVSKNSTLPAALPAFPKPSSNTEAPGQSKWIVTAVIVGAAVVTAIILLLHGWGGGDDKPHPPNGTIIAAGPPSVSAPTH